MRFEEAVSELDGRQPERMVPDLSRITAVAEFLMGLLPAAPPMPTPIWAPAVCCFYPINRERIRMK
jgi:hypothetical protein